MHPAASVALLVLTAFALAPVAAAKPSPERAEYTGQPVGVGCGGLVERGDCPSLANSAVQFGPFDAGRMDLAIFDASGRKVGASLLFFDETQQEIGHGAVCGAVERYRMPENATYVVVTLDTAATPKHCAGLFGVATSGEVLARFR